VTLLLLAWAAHSAQADPVTFAYSGVVNRVEPALGGLVLGAGPIGPGTPFFGHFTYDPTARPDDLTGGVLTLFTPPTHFTLTLGRFHEEGRELGFATLPFGLIDAPLPTDLAEFLGVFMSPGRPFPHFAVPTERELLGAFEASRSSFSLVLADSDFPPDLEVSGRLTSLDVISGSPVPEPSALVLLGTGMLLRRVSRRTRTNAV